MKLNSILNSLISDEISAWWMYWFMAKIAKGHSYHAVSQELEKAAEDELDDHSVKLITWALSNNIEIDVMPDKLLPKANCPIEEIKDGITTEEVITISILAERCAIKTYKKYYELVKDSYPDLGHLLMDISLDEQEHLNEFLDLGHQLKLSDDILNGNSLTGESDYKTLSSRLKSLF